MCGTATFWATKKMTSCAHSYSIRMWWCRMRRVQVTANGSTDTISWTDPTPLGGQDAQGIPTSGTNAAYPTPTSSPKNEIGFKVQQTIGTTASIVATVPANITSWTDPAITSTNALQYTVVAYNAAGNSVAGNSKTATSGGPITAAATTVTAPTFTAPGAAAIPAPTAPTGLTQTLNGSQVTISWSPVAGATSYLVTYGSPATAATVLAPAYSLTIPAMSNSIVNVMAVGVGGSSTASAGLYNGVAYDPVAFTASQGTTPGTVTLTWANNPLNVNNVSGLLLSSTGATGTPSRTFAPTSTGASITGLTSNSSYSFTLQALSALGNSVGITLTVVAP